MSWRQTWWCVAAIGVFATGCGEDIPPQELTKFSSAVPSAEKKEEKPPENPFAAPPNQDQNTNPSSENPFETPQTPPAQAGYGSSGYGSSGPAPSQPATQDNTYGHGAPIVLKSETTETNIVQADGTVGRRGQGYGGGIITEPLSQYFQIQSRIEFLNMKNTLKNWQPLHNFKNPKTVAEFDKEILKASDVTLPELPRGHYYVYDPDAKDLDAVLTVAQPQQPQQPQQPSGR
jgi:hypothetical protein